MSKVAERLAKLQARLAAREAELHVAIYSWSGEGPTLVETLVVSGKRLVARIVNGVRMTEPAPGAFSRGSVSQAARAGQEHAPTPTAVPKPLPAEDEPAQPYRTPRRPRGRR